MSVTLHTDAEVFEAQRGYGRLLTEIAEDAGLPLNTRCGGDGVCGGCAVKLEAGDYVVADEHVSLSGDQYRVTLACQTRLVSESARVRFPRTSVLERDAKIDDTFAVRRFRLQAQTGKYCLTLPIPALNRVPGLWESAETRLVEACGIRRIDIPLGLLRTLPETVAEAAGTVTFTVGRRGRGGSVIDAEAGDTTGVHIGAAVDVGTTTVVVMLVDLNQGTVMGKASLYNQQIRRADDVASRIGYARSPEALQELQRLVVEDTINRLLGVLCRDHGVDPRRICRIAISGNTVMTHLVLGLSPTGIGTLPFQPVTNCPGRYTARELGLAIHPDGLVDLVPSISGYVGGDIVSDIYVSRLRKHPELCLLVDIGTNGEIVLSEQGRLVVCATAAGPAFEGYGMSQGCRAATGAVEHLRFDRSLGFSVDVIGGTAPTGFCGSAVVDFIANGRRCGLINAMGRFDVDLLKARGRYLFDEALCGTSHACRIVDAEATGIDQPLFLSEADVAQVLKAKAAVYAGMRTLLDARGRSFGEVKRLFLAGGFARHIDLRNAMILGILPDIPLDRIEVIGNGSLAGAFLALLDGEALAAYAALARVPETIELNLQPGFQGHFVEALAVPNLDDAAFPSVNLELRSCLNPAGAGEC